jgi:hypothetical protein
MHSMGTLSMHSKCLDFFFIFPLCPTCSLQVLNVLPLGLCVKLKLISPLWMIYEALKILWCKLQLTLEYNEL